MTYTSVATIIAGTLIYLALELFGVYNKARRVRFYTLFAISIALGLLFFISLFTIKSSDSLILNFAMVFLCILWVASSYVCFDRLLLAVRFFGVMRFWPPASTSPGDLEAWKKDHVDDLEEMQLIFSRCAEQLNKGSFGVLDWEQLRLDPNKFRKERLRDMVWYKFRNRNELLQKYHLPKLEEIKIITTVQIYP